MHHRVHEVRGGGVGSAGTIAAEPPAATGSTPADDSGTAWAGCLPGPAAAPALESCALAAEPCRAASAARRAGARGARLRPWC